MIYLLELLRQQHTVLYTWSDTSLCCHKTLLVSIPLYMTSLLYLLRHSFTVLYTYSDTSLHADKALLVNIPLYRTSLLCLLRHSLTVLYTHCDTSLHGHKALLALLWTRHHYCAYWGIHLLYCVLIVTHRCAVSSGPPSSQLT